MLRLDVKSDLSDHWEKLVSRLRYQRNVSKKDPKSIKTTIVSQLRSPTELSSGSSTIGQRKTDSSISTKVKYMLSPVEKQDIVDYLKNYENKNK